MLYTKIQPQSFFGSGEEEFLSVFTTYGHGGHLIQCGTIEQIVNTFPQKALCEIW